MVNYGTILAPDQQYMQLMFGSCEVLNAHDTWQFPDYSKYDTVLSMSKRSNVSATTSGRRTYRRLTSWASGW